ncbi:VOC family protein [Phocicoccus schoeneichii]|uniref:3-demethylubiquinone-9 3-methyltransferase n=2 Tax=Phocicoccus schoeneichii TaxID=1812261 RepID=A0A6V7RMM8_9BACL|nr:VOC family protein [Jeotgalicoccus schoeneichii]GGH55572.1 VOC family protein [Jeotgalicoccus schoeneichii]CAD2079555.1 3-demethylubiquinone-9 3-methyltransferase [Jeotgalicoccus schoeneichii]
MKSITPFLMFEGRAEEAIMFYQSVFDDVEVVFLNRFGPESNEWEGKIMQGLIRIGELNIMVSDSSVSHDFSFTPSTSLFIECESMNEQMRYYEKIKSKGAILMPIDDYGFSKQFAWVSDPFGFTWQLNLN